jgi:inner membrane protein
MLEGGGVRMPSAITHAVVGLGLADIWAGGAMPWPFYGLSMALAAAPDLDVVGLRFGVPYGSFFGHRGFFHSLLVAVLVGFGVGWATSALWAPSWWWLGIYFIFVIASHGLLDCFTNGGLGIALLSPFDTTRYFFPWQPIQVAPISLRAFFGPWGWWVMRSEIKWVWLPLAVAVGAAWEIRRLV